MAEQARKHHKANAKLRAFSLLSAKPIQRVEEALAPIYEHLNTPSTERALHVQKRLSGNLYNEHIAARDTIYKWSQHDQNRLFPSGYFPGNNGLTKANIEDPNSQKCKIDPW
jgi:hypothetical protein